MTHALISQGLQRFAPALALGLMLCNTGVQAAPTTLYETNFQSGLGIFTGATRVTTGTYGVRMRGGTGESAIASSAINITNATSLTLTFNRTTSGLDAGESAKARYSFDGTNFTQLESIGNTSGSVTFNLPSGQTKLYLRFGLTASSSLETYTIPSVKVVGETGTTTPPPTACTSTINPGETVRNVSVGGVNRSYILNVPSSYAKTKTPLVLDFHPLTSDADYQLDNSGTNELSETANFIVAYPNGIDGAWNFGPCCTESRTVDDIGFARAIVADVKRNLCVDEKRIYAMGYSNGGGMSYHLACNATDLVAAVAPAAFDLVQEMSCNPSRPISVYSNRGRYDFIVPYSGGESTPPTDYDLDPIHFLGAEATFERWKTLDSCTGSSTTSGYPSGCKGYKSCAGGTEVVLCTESFGGHSGWDATKAWNFLKTKTLP